VKIRNEAVHPTLGTPRNGQREALGPRIADTEGAGFCRPVTRELRNRGVRDTPIAAVDGLKGVPETTVQSSIVPLVRHSQTFRSRTDLEATAAGPRDVHGAQTTETARNAPKASDAKCARRYPAIARARRRAREPVIPSFALSPAPRGSGLCCAA